MHAGSTYTMRHFAAGDADLWPPAEKSCSDSMMRYRVQNSDKRLIRCSPVQGSDWLPSRHRRPVSIVLNPLRPSRGPLGLVISAALSCTTIAAAVAPVCCSASSLSEGSAHGRSEALRPTPNSDIFLSKSKEKKGAENSDIWWLIPCQVATGYR